mgnify:CR=1
MKKSLAVLILLSVLSMGLVGALSIVPHVHGDDFDHSKHTACPIYQVGIHGLEAVVTGFLSVFVFSAIVFLLFFTDRPIVVFSSRVFSGRAPPTLL